MSGNLKMDRVYLFIARDNEEYERYKITKTKTDEEKTGEKIAKYKWRYSKKLKQLRIVIRKDALGSNVARSIQPENGDLIIRMWALKTGKPYPEDRTQDMTNGYVRMQIEEMLKEIQRLLEDLKSEYKEQNLLADQFSCYVFVHWGGGDLGDMEYYEKKVAEFMAGNFDGIFSIGTNRNDKFDVDGTRIFIPYDCESLQKLFEVASTDTDIKDYLTKLAVMGSSDLSDDETEHIKNFLAKELVRQNLRRSMNLKQVMWLKDWKAFQEYLNAIDIDTAKGKALKMLKDKANVDQTKAFATQLLSISQILPEGVLV